MQGEIQLTINEKIYSPRNHWVRLERTRVWWKSFFKNVVVPDEWRERGCSLELIISEYMERNGSAQKGSKTSCQRKACPYLRGTLPYETVPKSPCKRSLNSFHANLRKIGNLVTFPLWFPRISSHCRTKYWIFVCKRDNLRCSIWLMGSQPINTSNFILYIM